MKKFFNKFKYTISALWSELHTCCIIFVIFSIIPLVILGVQVCTNFSEIVDSVTKLGKGNLWRGILYIILRILGCIGILNTFYAYGTTIDELQYKMSERWLKIYIIFSIICFSSLCAFIALL